MIASIMHITTKRVMERSLWEELLDSIILHSCLCEFIGLRLAGFGQ